MTAPINKAIINKEIVFSQFDVGELDRSTQSTDLTPSDTMTMK